MNFTFYEIIWLFFLYAIAGWLLETIYAVSKKRKFINRGILNGPVCVVYGLAAVVISIAFGELKNNILFLFLGSSIVATFLEWMTGRLLERINHRRWWDYSHKKWNLDGYVCLSYSLLWGALGVLAVLYINDGIMGLYHWMPPIVSKILVWVLLVILIIDYVGSLAAVLHIPKEIPAVEEMNQQLTRVSKRVYKWVVRRMQDRMEKAYPSIHAKTAVPEKTGVFAEGLSFYKLFILFVAGAFLGDIIETIFCRFTAGVWMSRSSVVWGPFSVVWGLALAIATAMLYKSRDKSDGYLFAAGTLVGGAYEYLCSVFTEMVFGTVFWDYSDIPFNLGGRVNLLYCFFWGIAAVLWIKLLYPILSAWIEKIPKKIGTIFTWLLLIFMVSNMAVSMLALIRYDTRADQKAATSSWEVFMDERFGDERMERIYPNAISK